MWIFSDFVFFFSVVNIVFCVIRPSTSAMIGSCPVIITYKMEELMSLRTSLAIKKPPPFSLPKEIRPRKRGKKGGIKVRNKKRGFKPFLPKLIIGNAQSVNNKMDELWALTKHVENFRTSSLICFTETWLTDMQTDENIEIENFHVHRGDRDKIASGKTRAGGVCTYINSK